MEAVAGSPETCRYIRPLESVQCDEAQRGMIRNIRIAFNLLQDYPTSWQAFRMCTPPTFDVAFVQEMVILMCTAF